MSTALLIFWALGAMGVLRIRRGYKRRIREAKRAFEKETGMRQLPKYADVAAAAAARVGRAKF